MIWMPIWELLGLGFIFVLLTMAMGYAILCVVFLFLYAIVKLAEVFDDVKDWFKQHRPRWRKGK